MITDFTSPLPTILCGLVRPPISEHPQFHLQMLSDETRPLLPSTISEVRDSKVKQDQNPSPLLLASPVQKNAIGNSSQALWCSRIARLLALGTAAALLSVLVWGSTGSDTTLATYHKHSKSNLLAYDLPSEIAHNLGPYAPSYKVRSFGEYPEIDTQVPRGCVVTQVNILQRHGARYPEADQGDRIRETLDKLKRVTKPTDAKFAFVTSYNFTFGANDLLPFGRKQAYLSGRRVTEKYHHLKHHHSRIFIRSASKDRIGEASRWFKHGFFGGKFPVDKDDLAWPDVVIPAGPHSNNTLLVKNCKEAPHSEGQLLHGGADTNSSRRAAPQEWLSVYAPPIAKRLNAALPGAELTIKDVKNLMDVCGYETASKEGKPSPWCHLFTHEEWESNQYFWDLVRYWRQSHGSPVAASQGSGWVNELLARLTETSVHLSGPINRTLDTDPATFPLPPHAPSIFADFSSDVTISHMIAALGILKDRHDLPPKGPIPRKRLFDSSKTTPFAGNLLVERLVCHHPPHHHLEDPESQLEEEDAEDGEITPEIASSPYLRSHKHIFVRMLFNDAVVPLEFKLCGKLGERRGLCELRKFVRTQKFSQKGGEWDKRCVPHSKNEE